MTTTTDDNDDDNDDDGNFFAWNQPNSVTSGLSSTTNLIAALSALGQTIPPFII